jgi:hypothetical protein
MMVLFFQAARLALVVFDPYLSSRPLAKALMESPPGALITQGFYWKFASVFFYTGRTGAVTKRPPDKLGIRRQRPQGVYRRRAVQGPVAGTASLLLACVPVRPHG